LNFEGHLSDPRIQKQRCDPAAFDEHKFTSRDGQLKGECEKNIEVPAEFCSGAEMLGGLFELREYAGEPIWVQIIV
jgi:hypothetical protein